MRRKKSVWIASLYVVVDLMAVLLGFLTTYYLRFSDGFTISAGAPSFGAYLAAIVATSPIFLILFRHFRLYESGKMFRRWDVLTGSVYAITSGLVLCMAITFLYRTESFTYSRSFVFLSWFFLLLFFNLLRYWTNKIERRWLRKRGYDSRVVILGINRTARLLLKRIKDSRYSGYYVRGVYAVGSQEKGGHLEGHEILGDLEDFKQDIQKLRVDEVILTEPKLSREETAKLMLLCEARMIHFRVVADLYGMVTSAVEVTYVNNVPILGLKNLPLDDVWSRFLKRTFDILSSGLGLLLASPLLLFLAALIKISDGGPIFYKQERIGKNGKTFSLYKFRTMIPNAEKTTGPVWARSDDDRKTPIGNFLRRTNLDEIPQLWNVLIGEMSLVGPRPERPFFVEKFKNEIPRYMTRHAIKPGLTGWAQVCGYRGEADVNFKGREKTKIGIRDLDLVEVEDEKQLLHERIQLDLYYLENWSLFFDVEIILRTVTAFKNAF